MVKLSGWRQKVNKRMFKRWDFYSPDGKMLGYIELKRIGKWSVRLVYKIADKSKTLTLNTMREAEVTATQMKRQAEKMFYKK